MNEILSQDGTRIAFDQSGQGPAVIVVAAALADHKGAKKVAGHLAEHFTVINYDRRGRGQSTDMPPYAIAREIEDIEALIDHAGGQAFLFGTSSGSVLALDAASKLGSKVKKLFMYEPPFIINGSQPPVPETFIDEIQTLVAANKRNDAVRMFFHKGMGIPGFAVMLMRFLIPGWSGMAKIAHTIPYDLTILAGTQAGEPLPFQRWSSLTTPTRVMVGSKSEPFFHDGAQALAEMLLAVQYCPLEGRDHSAILMAAKALADAAVEFFIA